MPNILYPLNLRYAPITFKQLNQTLNFIEVKMDG